MCGLSLTRRVDVRFRGKTAMEGCAASTECGANDPNASRLKAYRPLPILRAALVAHATEHVAIKEIAPQTDAA